VADRSVAARAGVGGILRLGGDLPVARLGFGAMRLTGAGAWGDPPDRAAAKRLVRRAVDLGVNFIDTADAYGPGVSETLIAEALRPYASGLVIATKGGLTRPGASEWRPDGRPVHLRAACEASLRRLSVDRLDLYQLHAPDPRVPFEESVGALVQLRADGKIRHIGLANVSLEQLRMVGALTPIVSVQNRYTLTDRTSETVLEHCIQNGIAFIPRGLLASNHGLPDWVSALARRHGVTVGALSLEWALARATVILPAPTTASIGHLEANVAAADISLSREDIVTLTALSITH
jgi:pyridoxine 4-dehydrogenase